MRRLSSSNIAAGFPLLATLASLVALTSVCAQPAPESPSTLTMSREVKDVFERCSKAVVKIEATDQHGDLSGTGFFIDPMGTLYTSYSGGGEAENINVEYKGKKYPARQLMADLRSGVALLKADLASPALPIGNSDQLEIATPVVAIGYPLDLAETPSFGMIAGFDRKCFGGFFPTRHLRVNLPPQRGEGGAPLLNLNGEVVGILLYSFENNSCYALPIEAAEKLRSDYVRFGEPRYGWIGTNVQEASAPVDGSRAVTTEVMKGTPAAEAGLKPGDVVLQIGRTKVHEPEDILEASFFLTAGDAIPITVARGNEKITFQIQADVYPASNTRLAAPPNLNRAIPLNLQSAPEGTP
jgi:S1-C subfamily serine protease